MKLPSSQLPGVEALQALALLSDAGYTAYLVGGTVRNALLGLVSSDVDIATDALPHAVMALAKVAGIKAIPTGIDHGTVTLVINQQPCEITTFRRDVATNGRHAVVAFSTDVADDARRRDFTMNALYATAEGAVIDPLGGLPDLYAGRVRFIDDAEARIREDYLRILRFFRFTAWYGDPQAGLDPDGLAACASLCEGLETLSAERVTSEILKILAAPDPAPAVAAMAQAGVLARVLPGAQSAGLAPLVHAEAALELPADGIVRLACLGGETDRLRLSRAQATRLRHLRKAIGSGEPAVVLGYRMGETDARAVLALRQALLGDEPEPSAQTEAARGASQTCPVRAEHLPETLQGPEIGAALRHLEDLWLKSDLQLSREALLFRL